MRIAIASLGCSKNLVDTEYMLGMMKAEGMELVEDESLADAIIVNTCCFINDAKQESIDTILDVAQWKTDGNCKRLIVTGCLAQRYRDEIINELPEVDAVVGVGELEQIAAVLRETKQQVLCEKAHHFPQAKRERTTPPYTAFLKIADGCDNCCTYCIIPSVRGSLHSQPMEALVEEAGQLARDGVKELIVIAQDTTSYGVDLYGQPKLCQLLEQLCELDGIEWIRLHYCYPERITDELIDLIARQPKICNYLDIPIQHCNDQVLKRMGRRGNKEQLVDLIRRLREKIPGITIRTTLISGFPGETEEQYQELYDFVAQMRFERLGVFAYSQEEETPAAIMEDQIDEAVKLQRQEMLMLLQGEIAEAHSAAKVGKVVRVLVEGYDDLVNQSYGRTAADSVDIDGKVFFTSTTKPTPGQFVEVEITQYFDYDLFGIQKEELI